MKMCRGHIRETSERKGCEASRFYRGWVCTPAAGDKPGKEIELANKNFALISKDPSSEVLAVILVDMVPAYNAGLTGEEGTK